LLCGRLCKMSGLAYIIYNIKKRTKDME
jgi:hypothetical protein